MVLILEDDPDRIRRFRSTLQVLVPAATVVVWSDAHAMIREVQPLLASAKLISLDHDLYAPAGSPDPGDGLDSARYLVSLPMRIPVIVHSSNADRSSQMVGEFELAGWPCTRVLPFGADWVESEWRDQVARVLGLQ